MPAGVSGTGPFTPPIDSQLAFEEIPLAGVP